MEAEIQRRYIMNSLLKRFFAVLFAFILLIGSTFTAVKAAEPSITFTDDPLFMYSGSTQTVRFTVENATEVTFDDPAVYGDVTDTDLELTMKRHGNTLAITANEGAGYGYMNVYLDGIYYGELMICVYDDSDGFELLDIEDVAVPVNYGNLAVYASTEPLKASYVPVVVKVESNAIAKPKSLRMPAGLLEFELRKPGTTKVTISSGSQSKSFNLTVLPEGDYAQYVDLEGEVYTFYIKPGESFKIPAKMVSSEGTCKDDVMTFKIEHDSNESGTVTLSSDGTVKGNKIGSVDIAIYTKRGRQAGVTVNVAEAPTSISFPEDTYYINQNGDWIIEPYPDIEPFMPFEVPIVYTSSNPKAVDVKMVENYPLFTYVGPGEATIRAAYKADPKIYGEFKAVAFEAADPTKISAPASITLYPDFNGEIPLEFTPFKSFHEITDMSIADTSIAYIVGAGNDWIFVGGLKPGKTTLTIKAGPKASTKVAIEVKSGMPASENCINAGESKSGSYSSELTELTDSFRFVKGKGYALDIYKMFEDDLGYDGDKDLIGVDVKKNLEATGLFKVTDYEIGPAYYFAWITPIKSGTATVELVKGDKRKLTVIDTNKVEMYRLYNPNSGEHFYTAKAGEKDALVKVGWNYEGIGWNAPGSSIKPVYRLYNANAGDHHYTMKEKEKDVLVEAGWTYEGVGWYSDVNEGVPLYRQYNPNAVSGSHNYTTNKKENDALVKLGWKEEGIGWYGVK